VILSLNSQINVLETQLHSFDERRNSTHELRVFPNAQRLGTCNIDNICGFL